MIGTAIDLFAGAGGLSLGLKRAGFNVVAAFERDGDALATHAANMPGTEHVGGDVQDVDFARYAGVDLVAGGPPCQPFSVSGKRLGVEDARDMVPEFVRAVREIRPLAFLMENVDGLAGGKFLPYLKQRVGELEALGYEVRYEVLNAVGYGAPQNRKRLILVGMASGPAFQFPAPTHGVGRLPLATVADALAGCPHDAPNGAKISFAKNPVLRRSPFAGLIFNGQGRPIDPEAQAPTIPASAGGNRTHFLDPDREVLDYHAHLMGGGEPRVGTLLNARRLTVRQSARLQTFPDEFEFTGPKSRRYSQIGNAVPPLFAEALAAALLRRLDDVGARPAVAGAVKEPPAPAPARGVQVLQEAP